MESLAHPRVGGSDHADLFAGTPFKTTGWAGYENHRQYDQRSGEQREKERSPKTHPPMGAAVTRKQAGDDVGENGYCHDLTATNSLSQVCYYEFTVRVQLLRVYRPGWAHQVSRILHSAAKHCDAHRPHRRAPRLGRGSCCHEKLRLVDVAAPRLPNTPSSLRRQRDYGDEVAVVELALRPLVRDSHISFCALTNSR